MPSDLMFKLSGGGIFNLCLPRALGGDEADARTVVETIEELARADGSVGWCAMIATTGPATAGHLSLAAARTIFGTMPTPVTAGVFAPRGVAEVVDGGYRLTARWPFASACQGSAWFLGGAIIGENGAFRTDAKGRPEIGMFAFPTSSAVIHDTWNTVGLLGTGSHDLEVNELFVPSDFAASFAQPVHEHGARGALPFFGLLASSIAAVALGIARAAADELLRISAEKTPFGSKKQLRERTSTQLRIADVEATLRSTRAFLLDAVSEASAKAKSGEVPLQDRAVVRLAACHAASESARAVTMAYNAVGATSIFADSHLQRCLRDVNVVTQHVMVGPALYELAGRVLAGLDADTSML